MKTLSQQELKSIPSLFIFPEEPVAIIREIRNYLAGRTSGISRDEALLEEVLKILFCLINFPETKLAGEEFETAREVRGEFSRLKSKLSDFYGVNEEILLDPKSIQYVADGLLKILSHKARQIDIVASLYQAFIGGSIRGQEGQFFTPRVAVDFLVKAVAPKSDTKIIDTACGACSFLTQSYVHVLDNYGIDEAKSFAQSFLFGIEKDEKLTRLAKIHLYVLTQEIGNIYNADSLLKHDGHLPKIKDGSFDVVITNPPFGARIKSADEETSALYELGYKWESTDRGFVKTNRLTENTPPQVLFMERNIRALRPGGVLATVIPESLVSNKNYKNVVQYLLANTVIEAVIGMPESLFKTSGKGGTHTKTCLLLARKKPSAEASGPRGIFLAEAKWCGHDSRGNGIPKNDLPQILENYLAFKKGIYQGQDHLGYVIKEDQIEDFILAPRYYNVEIENSKKRIQKNHSLLTIADLVERGAMEISTGDEVGKLAYGSGQIPYIRTSDITNWEIKLDAKQRVDRAIYEKIREKQDIQEGDIFMVKDGTYLIGTVAIVTKFDVESIYQSHIYKIRVRENDLGLTPYNFLGLLSSAFVQKQIKSKQLTQDIIDSLGKRIYDLHIPIAKDSKTLSELHNKVLNVIDLKTSAKQGTLEVLDHTNFSFS